MDWSDRFAGALLGAAVGDALGLPREGLSRRRARAMYGGSPLRHRLVFGRGMVSDDTEHLCMTGQALLAARGEARAFARSLAWRLRWWLLGEPAGVGFATLRAIVKLWLGFSPAHSGVYSAGNGPAMRAAILGVWAAARGLPPEQLRTLVEASSRMTHTDPRATEGALAVALVANWMAEEAAPVPPPATIERLLGTVAGDELCGSLHAIPDALARGLSTSDFADTLGLARGVTGYINHTVPVALYAVLRWPDEPRRALEDVILAGGDTDSTGAIVGALCGIQHGPQTFAGPWLDRIAEWPRSTAWMARLGERLARDAVAPDAPLGPLPLAWPGLVVRNPLLIVIVLLHGFRRLLPPYA